MSNDDLKTRFVRYIGRKPCKTDTVTKTNVKWAKRGQVIEMPNANAVRLFQYPGIWVEADTDHDPMKDESHDGVEGAALPVNVSQTREERLESIIGEVKAWEGVEYVMARLSGDIEPYEPKTVVPEPTVQSQASGLDNQVLEAIKLLQQTDPDGKSADFWDDNGQPALSAINSLLNGETIDQTKLEEMIAVSNGEIEAA